MPKREKLTEKQINKIKLLRLQNLSYHKISIKLLITEHAVRKHCADIKPIKEEITVIKIQKRNKYDHIFEEPVCDGKMYVDYFPKDKQNIFKARR